MESARLELTLFGGGTVRVTGSPNVAVTLPTRKAVALLAYLALEGPTPRGRLADLLWGEHAEREARQNLRQEVYRLQATPLGPWLAGDRQTLALRPPFVSDVEGFRSALAAGRLSEALEIYAGPLLEGLELRGAPGFEEWLTTEREALQTLRRDALAEQAKVLERGGDVRGALRAFEELIRGDELHELHHREAMRLRHRLGERAEALAGFERLRELLWRELALTPLPETLALERRIRSEVPEREAPRPEPGPGPRLAPPLVGREGEVARIEGAGNRLALLVGEPGVGKTRLALDFAAARGAALLLRGREVSGGTPFYPVAEALLDALEREPGALAALEPAWRREVERLLPVASGAAAEPPPPEGRGRFLEGLAQSLIALAGPGGSLVLDDFHWFDSSSAELVAHLARRVEGVRLVATARGDELRENRAAVAALTGLEREERLARLTLEPLSESDLRRLVGELSGNTAAVFSRRLHRATGGNPLFALETLRALFEAGELKADAGGWSTPHDEATEDYRELPIPTSVREAVVRRVERLGAAARRLLEAASLAGDPFGLDLLAEATALTGWEGVEALERAQEARLVEAAPGGYRFGHDLVRRALDDGLGTERRRLIHRTLAEATLEGGGPAARVADHLERGGLARRASAFRVRAAEEAARVYAYPEALSHYSRALENGADDRAAFDIHRARAALREHLDDRAGWAAEVAAMGEVAGRLGDPILEIESDLARADLAFATSRYEEAHRLAERPLERPGAAASQRLRALYRSGAALVNLGRTAEAKGRFEEALRRVPVAEPRLRGQLRHALAACAINEDDLRAARAHAEAALEVFRAAGDRHGEVTALSTLGNVARRQGDPSAVGVLEEALGLAREAGFLPLQRKVLLNLAAAWMSTDEHTAALPYLEEGLALAREPQDPHLEASYLMHLSSVHRMRGDLGAVIDAASTALSLFDGIGAARMSAFNRLNLAGFLLACGDVSGARALVGEARSLASGGGLGDIAVWLEVLEARCETAEGRVAAALEGLERVLASSLSAPADYRREAQRALAEAQLASGDALAALQTAARLEGPPETLALALAVRFEAEAALRRGGSDSAMARTLLASRGVPSVAKLALRRALAAALEAAGATGEALEHGREADALAARLAGTLEPRLQAAFLARWSRHPTPSRVLRAAS